MEKKLTNEIGFRKGQRNNGMRLFKVRPVWIFIYLSNQQTKLELHIRITQD